MNDVLFHKELDGRGFRCGVLMAKTKLALDKLSQGEVLRMFVKGAGTCSDFNAWSRITGHQIVDVQPYDDDFLVYIQKK